MKLSQKVRIGIGILLLIASPLVCIFLFGPLIRFCIEQSDVFFCGYALPGVPYTPLASLYIAIGVAIVGVAMIFFAVRK